LVAKYQRLASKSDREMASADVRSIAGGFSRTTALVVGDVMLDAYLWGRVDRISPEAPVPVVQVTDRSARLGGAANVARNIHALGAKPVVVSVTGDDDHARTLEGLLKAEGLSAEGVVRSMQRRTTVKTRIISGHQHVVRVDEEMEGEITSAEEELLLGRVISLLETTKPGVVILEDYNKGVLTERVITSVIALAHERGIAVAVDPKKKNFFAYRGVDLFKPNLKELREGLKIDLRGGDIAGVRNAVALLEERMANKASLITLSEHGVYVHAGNEEQMLPAHQRKIVDVSGAGDSVIAVAALCLAQGLPWRTLAAWSNLAGGLVCEQVGVVPVDRDRLLSEAEHLGI
jgi:rfaE bifunctional protein kinase chain/domain